MGEIKEGYCSTHGYNWCLCLKAMDELDKVLGIMFNHAKKKSKTIKTDSTPIVRPKKTRSDSKKDL